MADLYRVVSGNHIVIHVVGIVVKQLALGFGIKGAAVVFNGALFQRGDVNRLKAGDLAELLVGVVSAQSRPVMVGVEVDVFIALVGEAVVYVYRLDVGRVARLVGV